MMLSSKCKGFASQRMVLIVERLMTRFGCKLQIEVTITGEYTARQAYSF
ncbi:MULTISPECIES: hypothetical protein [Nostocales]|uniref:Uncharacterized protein n=3 Tax=Nostocales TaxID=1161 RepID=A0A8S9T722_9CYAN|nr:hypothetical protein [Tolypothrix bouteillei]KAF3888270.1 hypothetical protein DA73_0400024340 [Tolypothrix bouteillei VB521301]